VELPYASIQLAGENFTVETDTNGRFVFNQTAPSGRVTLVAFEQIEKTFAIRETKPTEIIFDCAGKEIEGSLRYAGPEQIDWNVCRAVLFACRAPRELQPFDNLPDENEEEEWYTIETGANGAFGAPMIPPGNYKLVLTCAIENTVENGHDPGHLLTFSGSIVVGAGETPEKFHVMLTKEEQPIDDP
jgi:hypothetical protein